MSEQLWKCGRKKCGWVGTDEEKKSVPWDDIPNATKLVCPRCGEEGFYYAKPTDKKKPSITDIYKDFSEGKLIAKNKRQVALMNAWEAFLSDHDYGDLNMLRKIPEAFEELWKFTK